MLKTLGSRPQRRRAPSCTEQGFTLVELMVAMTISIILLTLTVTMVTVFSKAEASTVNSANSAANVRLVLLQLQSDIQSANPVGTLGSVAAYNDELQLTIQPSNQVITWQYSYATRQLTRQIGSGTATVQLTDVTNGDPASGGIPLFGYYDHCSINLVTQAQATAPSISAATTAVQVTLSVANVNSAPYGSTTTVHVMNQAPGVSRC
ncbi:MAG TPA: type II secretion system protein [Acidimicrobiales bacterium]|nr:type II secretion system protein [Acidimicrobiales bacterium]